MLLYFIRHGQSTNNLLWDKARDDKARSEVPELTDYGRRQVQILGDFIANHNEAPPATHDASAQNTDGFQLTHLYCSPMIRAMETARPIAKSTGLTPNVWVDLHEAWGIWNYHPDTGERIGLPGPDRAFFEGRFPEFILPDDFAVAEGWWSRPRETTEEYRSRGQRFVADLLTRHGDTDEQVAVVSHGGFYNAVMAALLGSSFRDGLWFSINNVGITRIHFAKKDIRFNYQNRVDFLPANLIT